MRDDDGEVIGTVVDDVVVATGPDGTVVDETIDVLDNEGHLLLEDETVSVYDADAQPDLPGGDRRHRPRGRVESPTMLKGIDPLLSGDLLKILDDMGHGDVLLLVDRNYPAAASGKPVVRLGEVSVLRAATAILSVFPLDSFVDHPLERMEVDDDPA